LIDKLELLIALTRERSFRRAAEACGVSQPSLSAGIKALEEALGVMLVRRKARFQGLTPEGERALIWARRMVADARAMRDDLRNAVRHLSGHLRIGVIPSALSFPPVITAAYRARHPDVRMTYYSRSSAALLRQIDELSLDAGITYIGPRLTGRHQAFPLYLERYRLLTTQDGPGSDRNSIPWADIDALPLCLLSPEMQNRRIVDRLMQQAGGSPAARHLESDSVVTLLTHVRTGAYATVVTEKLAAWCTEGGALRAVPITRPDAAFPVGLVVPRTSPLPPLVEALIAIAEPFAEPGIDRLSLSQHESAFLP
jgi:DNA-binding transcriptional LysR family regulator